MNNNFPTVYIQTIDGIPATRNLYDCYISFKNQGRQIKLFSDVSELENITKQDTLCAGIPVVRNVLRDKFSIENYELETYPKSLREIYNPLFYFGRYVSHSTVGQIRDSFEAGNAKPIFIKPFQQKLFTGFVVTSGRDLLKIVHVDDNVKIYTSTPIPDGFISEWRVYVDQTNKDFYRTNGIIGCHHYNGNPTVFPDVKKIDKIISTYNKHEHTPKAYSMDFGVYCWNDPQTVIIEANGFVCLGNYGLPSPLYTQGLETAWFEILDKGTKK